MVIGETCQWIIQLMSFKILKKIKHICCNFNTIKIEAIYSPCLFLLTVMSEYRCKRVLCSCFRLSRCQRFHSVKLALRFENDAATSLSDWREMQYTYSIWDQTLPYTHSTGSFPYPPLRIV